MTVVAAVPAFALLLGAAVGVHAPLPIAGVVACAGVAWVALSVLAWRGRRMSDDDGAAGRGSSRGAWLAVAAAAIGFAGGGAALAADAARRALTPPILADSRPFRADTVGSAGAMPMLLSGRLRADAVATEFGAAFTLDLDGVRLDGRERPTGGAVRIAVGGEATAARLSAWRAGRRVRVSATLSAPQPYRNIGTVEQETRLALAGIRLFGSVKSASHVELLAHGRWWEEAAAAARAAVRRALARHVGEVGHARDATEPIGRARDPAPNVRAGYARDHGFADMPGTADMANVGAAQSAAIVAAILIGDRAGLSEEVEERLQRAGTFHVIAISGGNVAILTALILGGLRLIGLPPRSSAGLTLVLVALYAVIVGAGASVARASLAACTYLFARVLDHRTPTLNVLTTVVCAILVWAPLEIVDPGFWLTCLATLAIIWLTPAIARRVRAACDALISVVPALATALAVLASPANLATVSRRTRVATTAPHFLASQIDVTASPRGRSEASGAAAISRAPRTSRRRSRVAAIALTVGRGSRDVAIALVAATVATEAVLLPVTAYAFSQVSIAGLLLNFAAIPLMTVVQLAGLIVVASSSWAMPLADFAGAFVRVAATGLVDSARLVDVAAWSAPRVPPPPLWLVLGCHAGLVAAWFARPRTWQRRSAALVWTACAVLVVAALPLPSFTVHAVGAQDCRLPESSTTIRAPPLRVTVLDVAQGDATLVRWPDGSAWLIDTGGALGRFDVGTRVVSPTLWALAVRRLSTLVLTHGDLDHIGGARAVIRDFAPAEIWEGIPVETLAAMNRLRQQAQAGGLRWRSASADDATGARGPAVAAVAAARVWHPPAPTWRRVRVRNDDSIVLQITVGTVSIVLPGDIGPAVERSLARTWPHFQTVADDERSPRAAHPSICILKVPHHGSRTSSTADFLDALSPQLAIVSAGRGNRHGHPAPDVLARYASRGTTVLRTDRDGAVQLDTDGRTLVARTCSGRLLHLGGSDVEPP